MARTQGDIAPITTNITDGTSGTSGSFSFGSDTRAASLSVEVTGTAAATAKVDIFLQFSNGDFGTTGSGGTADYPDPGNDTPWHVMLFDSASTTSNVGVITAPIPVEYLEFQVRIYNRTGANITNVDFKVMEVS